MRETKERQESLLEGQAGKDGQGKGSIEAMGQVVVSSNETA